MGGWKANHGAQHIDIFSTIMFSHLKKSTEPRPIVFNLHKSKMILQLLCEMLKMFILKAISGAIVV